MVDKERLHRAIDELSPEGLEKIDKLIELLQSEERGSAWAKDFYDLFAPMRQHAIDMGMSSDEINQLIDESIAEVRRERNA